MKRIIDEKFEHFFLQFQNIFNNALNDAHFEKPVEYLTVKEVMAKFSVSKQTVHNWTKRNIIKAEKIGNRVLYRKTELEKALSAENYYMPPEQGKKFHKMQAARAKERIPYLREKH